MVKVPLCLREILQKFPLQTTVAMLLLGRERGGPQERKLRKMTTKAVSVQRKHPKFRWDECRALALGCLGQRGGADFTAPAADLFCASAA